MGSSSSRGPNGFSGSQKRYLGEIVSQTPHYLGLIFLLSSIGVAIIYFHFVVKARRQTSRLVEGRNGSDIESNMCSREKEDNNSQQHDINVF